MAMSGAQVIARLVRFKKGWLLQAHRASSQAGHFSARAPRHREDLPHRCHRQLHAGGLLSIWALGLVQGGKGLEALE